MKCIPSFISANMEELVLFPAYSTILAPRSHPEFFDIMKIPLLDIRQHNSLEQESPNFSINNSPKSQNVRVNPIHLHNKFIFYMSTGYKHYHMFR